MYYSTNRLRKFIFWFCNLSVHRRLFFVQNVHAFFLLLISCQFSYMNFFDLDSLSINVKMAMSYECLKFTTLMSFCTKHHESTLYFSPNCVWKTEINNSNERLLIAIEYIYLFNIKTTQDSRIIFPSFLLCGL